jgi:arsenate reductase
LLQSAGVSYVERLYLKDVPSTSELQAARDLLKITAFEMMRPGESVFKDLGLSRDIPEDDLLNAMAAHPKLIERPIVFRGEKAVIGRPTNRISEILFPE